jgi:hypothetical protein
MRIAPAVFLCACCLAAACHDATEVDVCARPHACEVPGWDLALLAAALDNPVANDSASGLPVAPRELRVRFTVRNRGDVASWPARVVLGWNGTEWVEAQGVSDSVWIGPLEPGDSVVSTAMLRILNPYFHYGDEPQPISVRVSIGAQAEGLDEHPENDTLATSPMHLGLALLRMAVEPIGAPRLQVNEPFWVRYRVWNAGYHEALAGVSGVVCLWADGDPCFPRNFTVFGRQVLPPIAPGDTLIVEYPTAVAPTAAWQDEAYDYWYSVCIEPSSWNDPYMSLLAHCAWPERAEDSWVRVRPDYEGVCAPPLLTPGSSITLTYNCGFMPVPEGSSESTRRAIQLNRFHLLKLDAAAGVTYLVQPVPNYVRAATGDRVLSLARADSLRFAVSGRYYLLTWGTDTLTFTMKLP